MDPLSLHGPQFLGLYLSVTAITTVAGMVYRSRARNTGTACETHPVHSQLDPYEIAYLRGGKQAVLDAALAHLIANDVIDVQGDEVEVRPASQGNEHPVVQELRNKLVIGRNTTANMRNAMQRWKSEPLREMSALRASLERAGYVVSESLAANVAMKTVLIVAAPMIILGLPKLLIGLSLGKPVQLLSVMLLVNVIIAALLGKKIERSERGDRALQSLKSANEALKTNAHFNPAALSPMQTAMVAGLFGCTAFSTGEIYDFNRRIAPPPSSSGSSCGGVGGCGGGGCGGGCGGCGS